MLFGWVGSQALVLLDVAVAGLMVAGMVVVELGVGFAFMVEWAGE